MFLSISVRPLAAKFPTNINTMGSLSFPLARFPIHLAPEVLFAQEAHPAQENRLLV
ncbi:MULTISPECIES: hypothetical protein [unclassified Mesorhizobium]|uniref:hypothetical protein n=1 Tax=unclassified Mesorhizobium TaxID=325217 RepID=UPI0015C99EE3|nr:MULTISPECIES: hypothetical protein [unclassified Mesorhizobium]MDG4908633.1 hypothetical protein [Mesorhizobium sp. WSM4898]MDG4917132.1 hypothetical protein [Mesorhizobium sp. WSM4989]WIE90719.1 hypothetical protein P9270_024775 [Mesorhizobium sp. WSM4875]